MNDTLKRELAAIGLAIVAVFLGGVLLSVALASLHAGGGVRGDFGLVGSLIARPLLGVLGWAGAVVVPIIPLACALRLFGRGPGTPRAWLILMTGLALLAPVAAGLIAGAPSEPTAASGLWGAFAAFYAREFFGAFGSWLVVVAAVSILTAATVAWNPIRMLLARVERAHQPAAVVSPDGTTLAERLEPDPDEMPAIDLALVNEHHEEMPSAEAPAEPSKRERKPRKKKGDAAVERAEEVALAIQASAVAEADDDLPPTDLLTPAPPRNGDLSRRDLDAAGQKLMEALRTFRVEGELVGRTTGPTVTQFEIEPAAGVKVRQFANLANDLALAMRAPSIRIVAPIPGRGAVGVEVPNASAEIVAFREIVESKDFQQARAALPIALGKDLEGRPIVADLAKMPHLLIAGATGSGKSVCVNTIITSLIYRHTPKTLRFLMVDPKMVELSVYNTLPHLRYKVVTDNRDAAAMLKWAVIEMQERYELLAANGCRNIQDFNRRVHDGAELKLPKRPDVAFERTVYDKGILPYIVVVIDEMADLMMTVQGEVETPIAMLAQKARAIGIHLILATQRPSVNVITGLIKANFPSRIAFRVASQVDSRTIIDGAGAEMLLGNGDMLFIPPGKSEPARLQGAFLGSDETERLIKWYDDRRDATRRAAHAAGAIAEPGADEPDILELVRKREAAESGGGDNGDVGDADRDKLFFEAAEVCIQHQGGSTSLLQRRLKIGYGRAARIIDQLHAAGVLGPPDGSKPRDVLMGLEDLHRIAGPTSTAA